jgi:hypothetical protein
VIAVERFGPDRRQQWDEFVAEAKNGVFLFFRDYMEYHQDRFTDHSLLFRNGETLVAVLPANEVSGTLVSHGGLTFGGMLSGRRMTTPLMVELFAALQSYMRGRYLDRLVYKAVPHIYHDIPAEEDLYALFRSGARLVRRDVSSTILMADRPPVAKGRKSSVNVALRNAVIVGRSSDFRGFMALEAEHLQRQYGTKPVHSGDEMVMLATRFPEQIKLFTATVDGKLLAGTIVYDSRQVAHTQYIAASEEGRRLCAHDLVMHHLLNDVYSKKRYFDFGISTERAGHYLNSGLVGNKESFGARATVYDFYELDIAS